MSTPSTPDVDQPTDGDHGSSDAEAETGKTPDQTDADQLDE